MIEGKYQITQKRGGHIVREIEAKNLLNSEGLVRLMTPFTAGTYPNLDVWMGLMDAETEIEIDVNDTSTTVPFDEFTNYIVDGSPEPEENFPRAPWAPVTQEEGRRYYNYEPAILTMTLEGAIAGVFLCFDEDSRPDIGPLFSEALFAEPIEFIPGDKIYVIYTITFPPAPVSPVPPYQVTQVIVEGN